MLFATHLVAAWLLGRRWRASPRWLVAGAALPDVVDKPLAAAGVVDLYHTVGHSGVTLALAVPVALVGRRGVALWVGWLSHLLLDALHLVVNGRADDVPFLGWPLTEPATPLGLPPVEFVGYYLWTPSFFLETVVWLALGVSLVAARPDGERG
ncbi:metal-dependent hydrolase [Haloplanus halophilus]|uniref:metal-dependent hydrolase n=1 Tax=Haloplanus halophilus TaxID=2949993 RepID=UPI00203E7E60|nr:metal-dependent hydrolase [Haloplanus sp. GDY1]